MKKILITENQFKKLIENILIEQYNDPEVEKFYKASKMKIWFLENVIDKSKEKIYPEYPDWIFYVDEDTGQKYMEYNKKNKDLSVDFDKIWSYFYSNYSRNYIDVRELIKLLMGEYYDLWDITPFYVQYTTGTRI